MKLHNRNTYHFWTKGEIRWLIKNWNKYSMDKISTKMKLEKSQINPFVVTLRKNGFSLPSKSRNRTTSVMLKELKREFKINK